MNGNGTSDGDGDAPADRASENGAARRPARPRPAGLAPPPELTAAPGFEARRLHQAYLAAWTKHVDPTLTGPQFALLSAVRAYPQADQTALAAAVALDTSTMADMCRRTERRGLIRRAQSPIDARRKLLSLTEAGAAVLAEAERRARVLDDALLAEIPPQERASIAELLNRLASRWENVAKGRVAETV
jgi:MarR family transcriptional regulator, temperature-dependent positive regulator of motility